MMRLGTAGVSGLAPNQFQQPTAVAIGRNGDIYVADGHANGGGTAQRRIVQFDRNGTFIRAWGRKGMGPGEFDMPHDLAIDSQGRVFVADRQNNRVQIFEADGRYVATWYQFGRPSAIFIDQNDTLYSADSESRDGRTNTGRTFLPASGYGYNPGTRRGIRIGSTQDGKVKYFIPILSGCVEHDRRACGRRAGHDLRQRVPRDDPQIPTKLNLQHAVRLTGRRSMIAVPFRGRLI
jgi:hypothetical protein